MRYTIGILTLLAVAVVGCEVTAPLPDRAEPFDPLAHYGLWWSMVEECSGFSRPMSEISWYLVPGFSFTTPQGEVADGLYQDNRIVLGSEERLNGQVVRHEMLHAILHGRVSGPLHPYAYFLRSCAGLVECNAVCRADSGSPPPPAAETVGDTALAIGLEIDSVVSQSGFGNLGYASVTVSARNRLDRPVIVSLSNEITFSANLQPPTFELRQHFQATAEGNFDPYFEAGETKRHVFDFYLPKRSDALGTWQAFGAFAYNGMTSPVVFRAVP